MDLSEKHPSLDMLLSKLSSQVTNHLNELWDEIGYGDEERERQTVALYNDVQKLCTEKVQEVEKIRERVASDLEEAKKKIETLSLDAGFRIPSLEESFLRLSLTEQLAKAECHIEEINNKINESLEDFDESNEIKEKIKHYAEILGAEDFSEYIGKESKNLDNAQLNKKLEEIDNIFIERCQVVADLVAECHSLIVHLKIEEQEELSEVEQQIMGTASLMQSLPEEEFNFDFFGSSEGTENCVGVSGKSVKKLENKKKDLSDEIKRRKDLLEDMGQKILALWQELESPLEERKHFTDNVNGIGIKTIELGRTELQRLTNLKSNSFANLVHKQRTLIEKLWNEIGVSKDEGATEFAQFSIDLEDCDENVLKQHEVEVEKLKGRTDSVKPILVKIRKREELCKYRIEALHKQKDPNRYKDRGQEAQKKLAEEIKNERLIEKRLPKLNESLLKALTQWETDSGSPFFWSGVRYIDQIESSESEYKEMLENKKCEKINHSKCKVPNNISGRAAPCSHLNGSRHVDKMFRKVSNGSSSALSLRVPSNGSARLKTNSLSGTNASPSVNGSVANVENDSTDDVSATVELSGNLS